MQSQTRSPQSRGTWSGSAVDVGSTHSLPGLKRNQAPGSFETVVKGLRSFPMGNKKGPSLKEAIMSLLDCCRQMDVNYK